MSNANGNDKSRQKCEILSCVAAGQDVLSSEIPPNRLLMPDAGINSISFKKQRFTVCRIYVTNVQSMKAKKVLFVKHNVQSKDRF